MAASSISLGMFFMKASVNMTLVAEPKNPGTMRGR